MQAAVVFGADACFGKYLPVIAQSILENASPENHYSIIIFNCGIHESDIDILKRQIAPYNNVSFEVKNTADIFIPLGFRIKNQKFMKSPAMLAPLFIPQLCPEYERVIYADMDMIINRDIAELATVDLGENYLAATVDAPNEVKRLLQAEDTENNRDFYINSGLMVFNIQAWRQHNLTEKAISYLVEGKNSHFFDQAAINFVCKGHIAKLGTKWNNLLNCRRWFSLYDNKPKLKDSLYFRQIKQDWLAAYNAKDCVYHWTGWAKPWVSLQIPSADIWWHYAAKTERYPQFLAAAQKVKLFRESNIVRSFRSIPLLREKAFLNSKKYYLFGMKHGHIAEWRVDIKTGKTAFYMLGIKCYCK